MWVRFPPGSPDFLQQSQTGDGYRSNCQTTPRLARAWLCRLCSLDMTARSVLVESLGRDKNVGSQSIEVRNCRRCAIRTSMPPPSVAASPTSEKWSLYET